MSISKPNILSKKDWGGKDRRYDISASSISKSKITTLVIHHSAGPNGETGQKAYQRVRNIQYDHQYIIDTSRGKNEYWADLGYHFLISHDGLIFEGRSTSLQGAHAPGANKKSLGVCLLGTFNNTYISKAQEKSLIHLLAWLCQKFDVSSTNLTGHRDYRGKNKGDCPGNKVYNNISTIEDKVTDMLDGNDGGEHTGSGTTYYRVMAGSFSSRTNATKRKELVEAYGYDAFLLHEGRYYKVVAESTTSKKTAEKVMSELSATIDTFVSTYKKGSTTYYRVMAGAFTSSSNARKRETILEAYGYDAFRLPKEGRYYRVVALSTTSKSNAQRIASKIEEEAKIDCFISKFIKR